MSSKKSDLERHIPHSEAGARQQQRIKSTSYEKSEDRSFRREVNDRNNNFRSHEKQLDRQQKQELAIQRDQGKVVAEKVKGEYSLEILQEEFRQLPFRLDHDFEDFVRRENIRLQGVEAELKMKDAYAESELKRVKSDRTHEAQVYIQTSTHDHEQAKDFETHKASLGYYRPPAPEAEILTAEQLEAIREKTAAPAPSNGPLNQSYRPSEQEKPKKPEDELTAKQNFIKKG